jgi:hypothetical protein
MMRIATLSVTAKKALTHPKKLNAQAIDLGILGGATYLLLALHTSR